MSSDLIDATSDLELGTVHHESSFTFDDCAEVTCNPSRTSLLDEPEERWVWKRDRTCEVQVYDDGTAGLDEEHERHLVTEEGNIGRHEGENSTISEMIKRLQVS